ncbi:hypothetical protein ABEB36_009495 [Hypothenemus hampei]|uniref:Uncharacterized protein n=1 Tax=Hypothenemus hampei TaxID=57062 RepID=A0ABD1EH67_HYPHA
MYTVQIHLELFKVVLLKSLYTAYKDSATLHNSAGSPQRRDCSVPSSQYAKPPCIDGGRNFGYKKHSSASPITVQPRSDSVQLLFVSLYQV